MPFFSEFTCPISLAQRLFFSHTSEIPNTNFDACTFAKLWVSSDKLHWSGIFRNWFVGPWHRSEFWEDFRLLSNRDIKLPSENRVNEIPELSRSRERNSALMCASLVLSGRSNAKRTGQIFNNHLFLFCWISSCLHIQNISKSLP